MTNPTADAQNGKQVSPPYTPVVGCPGGAELDECRAALAAYDASLRLTQEDKESDMYAVAKAAFEAAWQARATTKGQDGVVSATVRDKMVFAAHQAGNGMNWPQAQRAVDAALAAMQEAKGQGGSDE